MPTASASSNTCARFVDENRPCPSATGGRPLASPAAAVPPGAGVKFKRLIVRCRAGNVILTGHSDQRNGGRARFLSKGSRRRAMPFRLTCWLKDLPR